MKRRWVWTDQPASLRRSEPAIQARFRIRLRAMLGNGTLRACRAARLTAGLKGGVNPAFWPEMRKHCTTGFL